MKKSNGIGYLKAMELSPKKEIFQSFPPIIEERSRGAGKHYVKNIVIEWSESGELVDDTSYTTELDFLTDMAKAYNGYIDYQIERGYNPYDGEPMSYDKTKVKLVFDDEVEISYRLDISNNTGDFNPYRIKNLQNYFEQQTPYDGDVPSDLSNYVFTFRGVQPDNPFFGKESKRDLVAIEKAVKERIKKSNEVERTSQERPKYRETAKLSLAEITKLIRLELAKKLPKIKFSVTRKNYDSINATVTKLEYNPFSDDFKTWLENGGTEETYKKKLEEKWGSFSWSQLKERMLSTQFRQDMKAAEGIHDAYNYNRSDMMTDYFDVRYYGSVNYQISDLILMVYPEKAKPKTEWQLAHEAKEAAYKEKLKEFRTSLQFERFEVAEYDVSWRMRTGKPEKKREYVIITKVPNGKSRIAAFYNVYVLREITDPQRIATLADQEKGDKNFRKWVRLVRIDNKFYSQLQEIKDVLESKLIKTTANWSHHLKGEKKPAPTSKVTAKPKEIKKPSEKTATTPKERNGNGNAIAELSHNKGQNGIEIKFSAIPTIEVREFLKQKKVRWSSKQKIWYVKYTDALWSEMQDYFKPKANPKLELAKAKLRLKLKLALTQ